ncbi:MAG: FMN-binding protein [Chlamydiae bacterium]|nr:FMN-binding protein [Chlamydiota bacterium]MBI3267271.1 FMN-binding protein [Chlamydiota bacterium]
MDAPSYAEVYLSVEQAQQVIFPGEGFSEIPLQLSSYQKAEIKKRSGIAVRDRGMRVWKTGKGDFLIVDTVLGKHEFITYAVGILSDGTVRQIEIMDYRETYGYQIRDEVWRKQFVGKNAQSELMLDKDIKNISGATLSCRHITDGVKRLLATYETVFRKK